jgi:hypothetical protein
LGDIGTPIHQADRLTQGLRAGTGSTEVPIESPAAAEGKIFLVNEQGKVAVLEAGRDWDVLAVNDLDEGSFATPALSQGRIYVRTEDALWCFGRR